MKKLVGVLLAVFIFGGSALAFAWWDSLTVEENNVTIGIGEGVTLQVVLDPAASTDELVPAGVVAQPGQTTSYVLTYNVDIDNTIDEVLDLVVTASNVQVNGDSVLGAYINVDITDDNSGTIQNGTVVVTVTVTLDMDSSTPSADVTAVKNQDITFDLTFEAQQQ